MLLRLSMFKFCRSVMFPKLYVKAVRDKVLFLSSLFFLVDSFKFDSETQTSSFSCSVVLVKSPFMMLRLSTDSINVYSVSSNASTSCSSSWLVALSLSESSVSTSATVMIYYWRSFSSCVRAMSCIFEAANRSDSSTSPLVIDVSSVSKSRRLSAFFARSRLVAFKLSATPLRRLASHQEVEKS